jgi:plastocyanin
MLGGARCAATLQVSVGQTVTWMFDSTGFTVTSGSNCTADGMFCSPSDKNCSTGTLSNAGQTYQHTFTTAGTFPYFDFVHCLAGMTGTIVVQ